MFDIDPKDLGLGASLTASVAAISLMLRRVLRKDKSESLVSHAEDSIAATYERLLKVVNDQHAECLLRQDRCEQERAVDRARIDVLERDMHALRNGDAK